jgi:hypothetical protein
MKPCIILLFCGIAVFSAEKRSDSTVIDLLPVKVDSLATVVTREDSLLPPQPGDRPATGITSDSSSFTDTTTQPMSTNQESNRKIKLIKRQYNYKQQVFLAIGMMMFVGLMMMTTQSWNPK